MPQPVPATPSRPPGAQRSRWPLYAGVAGVLAAIGIVVGIFAKSQSSAALQTTQTTLAAENAPRAAANAAANTAARPAATAASGKQVLLAAVPIDAHVYRNTEDLGQSPVMVAVQEGQSVELEIRRSGYKTDKITLDGSKTREVVTLDKLTRAGAVYRPPATKKAEPSVVAKRPKSAIGGSEIVNPWGN